MFILISGGCYFEKADGYSIVLQRQNYGCIPRVQLSHLISFSDYKETGDYTGYFKIKLSESFLSLFYSKDVQNNDVEKLPQATIFLPGFETI